MKDKVRPMLEAASKDYVSKDPAWPKRSEPCDKSSLTLLSRRAPRRESGAVQTRDPGFLA